MSAVQATASFFPLQFFASVGTGGTHAAFGAFAVLFLEDMANSLKELAIDDKKDISTWSYVNEAGERWCVLSFKHDLYEELVPSAPWYKIPHIWLAGVPKWHCE